MVKTHAYVRAHEKNPVRLQIYVRALIRIFSLD